MEIGITPSNPEALEDDWVIVGQALTAHSDLDLVERAKRTGPMSYLLKPFRDEELRTTIEIALYKHQLVERLRESEEKLRIIADSLPVLISYVDSEQRYQFNNKTYELWHQHKAKEIRGKRVRDVLGDQRYGKIVNHIELALSGETVRFEAALGCGDGRTRDIEATYVPHFGDKGEVKGFVGLVADITNRKAVEAALQRAKDELEAKVKERTAELAKRNEQLRWEVRQKESAEQEALMQTTLLNAVNRLLKEALESENERELARVCLSVAKEITRSEFAFIGELNKDGRLDTVALSDPGWKPRRMSKAKADKQLRNLPICGIWAPALSMERTQTINAPVLHPDSVGVPDGHPTITCFLGVPLKRAGKTFGLIGLGNKEGGYTSVDSQGVEALSIAFVEALERIRGKRLISEMHDLNERILSSSPVGIATFRSDGQCTMVNQAMASMIGATRAQVASQNFRDIESWKRSGLLEDAEEVLATGAARRREVHVISTFGQEVYLDCHFSRFTSGDDHHVLLTVNDISRLKQVEEELRVSEARFREIAELLPQFVYEIDGNGFLTFANTAGLEATGYTLEDLAKGLSLGDVIAPEDLDRALVDMERTMLGERIIGHEYALKRKDGTTLPIITYSDPVVREEKVVGFRGVAVDISERKEAERALRDSEERFRRLIESSPMGISIFQHGKRVYVNPAEVRMFGYDTAEEVLQLRAEDLYVPESRDLIVGLLAAVPDQETWLSGHEAMGVKKDGTVIDLVLWLSKAAFRGDPAVLSFVADISQEKSLREQLFRAQKMESLGTLAGGIAHDFNNLLTVVRGYSELLLASKKEEDQDYEDLRKIASAAQKGADLVRRILTFSRKIETHVRPIDLNDQIVQLRKILERTIPKMIEIRLHLG
ncbi:MAG: PAS domain S-box protein, partial [Deltaproteobacteria bacterium]|nr:PAS domain S-box protein [Deltaproteobacteria bacterium]